MLLVISASLHPASRSRLMALRAGAALERAGIPTEHIDLAPLALPACDGDGAYTHPGVAPLRESIARADGVLLACPVYNYDVGAAAKNLIELTGDAWTDRVVGFLCAAGGAASYMAPLGLANSLMLDFRCVVVPRFVYATTEAFAGDEITDTDVTRRIDELSLETARLARLLGRGPR